MKHIMIVVEEKGIANALNVLLKDKFLPVVVSPSSVSQSIMQRRPDIVIVDSKYSNVSSYQVVEQILNLAPGLPVIALVESFGPVARRFMEIGVYEVIEKPFDPEKFFYSINRALKFAEVRVAEKITLQEPVKKEETKDDSIEQSFFQKLSVLLAENFSSPSKLISSIINLLKVNFYLTGVSLFLRQHNIFVFHDGTGVDKAFMKDIRFTESSALFGLFMAEKRIVQRNRESIPELISELELLGSEVILPLTDRNGSVFGFFALGKRITGEPFTQTLIRFFGNIISYLSVLIEDSILFQDSVFQKELQNIVLENVPAGIIVLDNLCNVRIFNKQAENILGKNSDEIINFPLERSGVEFASKIREAIANRQAIFREEIYMKSIKKYLGLSCNFVFQGGEIVWTIVIFQDITHIREMEKQRKKIEQNQYWQQIAHQLSHEIKNPLVAIKTFACLLPEKFSDESFRTEFYGIVNGEIQRLTHLVEKIARLAETEPLVMNETNCFEVVQKVVKKFPSTEIVPQNGFDIITKIDQNKMQEVFEFLLDFCVQDAGEKGNVKVSLSSVEDAVCIIVEEKGGNINLPRVEDIFVPFSNGMNAITSLNLAICRKIIEQHSGKIGFEILPEGRRRFTITIPMVR
jgi:nitrogen-specific signal transduction histidine kinase/DNA-binding NarL/FixJ family response regulator